MSLIWLSKIAGPQRTWLVDVADGQTCRRDKKEFFCPHVQI